MASQLSTALLHDGDVDADHLHFSVDSLAGLFPINAEHLCVLSAIASLSVVMAADVYHHSLFCVSCIIVNDYYFWAKNRWGHVFKH